MAAQMLKSRVKAANDNKRQVRIPSETDGKPEIKTVLEYDTEAVDTLSVQSFIVRARVARPPAREQPARGSRSPRGHAPQAKRAATRHGSLYRARRVQAALSLRRRCAQAPFVRWPSALLRANERSKPTVLLPPLTRAPAARWRRRIRWRSRCTTS